MLRAKPTLRLITMYFSNTHTLETRNFATSSLIHILTRINLLRVIGLCSIPKLSSQNDILGNDVSKFYKFYIFPPVILLEEKNALLCFVGNNRLTQRFIQIKNV